MSMTIADLIADLEQAQEELGPQAEVRIAYQPNWPLRATVAHVTLASDPDEPYGEGEQAAGQENDGQMVWLAADGARYGENPYAPRWAWRHGEAA